jgi:conjugal transfer pilus assembly protein TraE
MTLGDFLSTWRGTTLENRVWRITVLVLVASNLILVGLVGQVERTVVLVPPVLEGEVTIAREYASQQVEESWGVYVAQLLGNRVVTDVKLLNNRNFVVPETSGKAEELVDQGR